MNIINKHIKGKHVSVKGTWFIALVCLSIVAGTYSNIFSLAAFAMAILAIFVLSDEDSLCMLSFIMPFANVFKISPDAQSFFTYIMVIYAACAVIRQGSVKTSFVVSLLSMVLLVVLQMFYETDIYRTIKLFVYVVFIYAAMNIRTTGDHEKVFMSYLLGIIVSSLIVSLGLIPNFERYVEAKDLGAAYDNEIRFAGLYSDPNYYTVNVIISLCLVIVLNHKKQLSNLAACVFGIILVTFAIMTYSKSAFLMLIFPLSMLLYSRIKKRNALLFLVLVFGSVVALMAILSGRIEAFNIVLERLGSGTNLNSLTTNRYSIWGDYIQHLSNINLQTFIGAGLGAEQIREQAAHNTYLDMLYYLGIVGTILLISAISVAGKSQKAPPQRNLLNYSVWISVLVLYFFLSELFYFDWSFHIMIALMVAQTDMQHIEPMGGPRNFERFRLRENASEKN